MSAATADKGRSSRGGIGFTGLLALLFIGLKLAGFIGWSWWWVLSPLWITALLVVVLLGVAVVVTVVKAVRS